MKINIVFQFKSDLLESSCLNHYLEENFKMKTMLEHNWEGYKK